LSASADLDPGSAVQIMSICPRVGGQFHAVVGEGDVADDRVVEVLGAGVVEADVVGGPAGAELFALRGQLAN